MRPRLRPRAQGLALFLGDQLLEPKLALTTLCALPPWAGQEERKGEEAMKGEEEEEKKREGEEGGE